MHTIAKHVKIHQTMSLKFYQIENQNLNTIEIYSTQSCQIQNTNFHSTFKTLVKNKTKNKILLGF